MVSALKSRPLGRGLGATYSGAYTYTFGYGYDAVGNRTVQTRTITSTLVTTYTYDAANRLATQNGQSIFTWDANGNLLQDGSTVYAYDFANRLISTTLSGVNTQFGYNGDGIRLRLIEAGTLTTYTQDYAAPLPVVLQAKTSTGSTQYVYSLGTRPLAEYEAAAWEYLLADALGSVRQIADPSGNVTLLKSYEPYGSVLNSQGTATSVFAYAGEQVDAYIKLVFLRARYYSPDTARFLSKDIWPGDYTRPQSLNGWGYVEGNPINGIDPSGLSTCFLLQDTDRCLKWIYSALEVINTGGYMSHAFLDRFYSDTNTSYWFSGNDYDLFNVPIIPFVDLVILPSSYLSDQSPPPAEHIGWFIHETVHAFRNPAERTTTFSEVEAFAVQTYILQELGRDLVIQPFVYGMLGVAMEGGQVTRDLDKLAQARCILSDAYGGSSTAKGWFYRHEALIFNYGRSFFGDLFCGCQSDPQ